MKSWVGLIEEEAWVRESARVEWVLAQDRLIDEEVG